MFTERGLRFNIYLKQKYEDKSLKGLGLNFHA